MNWSYNNWLTTSSSEKPNVKKARTDDYQPIIPTPPAPYTSSPTAPPTAFPSPSVDYQPIYPTLPPPSTVATQTISQEELAAARLMYTAAKEEAMLILTLLQGLKSGNIPHTGDLPAALTGMEYSLYEIKPTIDAALGLYPADVLLQETSGIIALALNLINTLREQAVPPTDIPEPPSPGFVPPLTSFDSLVPPTLEAPPAIFSPPPAPGFVPPLTSFDSLVPPTLKAPPAMFPPPPAHLLDPYAPLFQYIPGQTLPELKPIPPLEQPSTAFRPLPSSLTTPSAPRKPHGKHGTKRPRSGSLVTSPAPGFSAPVPGSSSQQPPSLATPGAPRKPHGKLPTKSTPFRGSKRTHSGSPLPHPAPEFAPVSPTLAPPPAPGFVPPLTSFDSLVPPTLKAPPAMFPPPPAHLLDPYAPLFQYIPGQTLPELKPIPPLEQPSTAFRPLPSSLTPGAPRKPHGKLPTRSNPFRGSKRAHSGSPLPHPASGFAPVSPTLAPPPPAPAGFAPPSVAAPSASRTSL